MLRLEARNAETLPGGPAYEMAQEMASKHRVFIHAGSMMERIEGVTMVEAIANCVRHVGIPLLEAVRMASLYPARVLQRDHELGKVRAGYLADLTVFDDSFVASGVVERGKWLPRDLPNGVPAVQPASIPT